MSSIYNTYCNLKKDNSENLYLFKSGNFYIFLDEDAKKINKITTLKLINHSKNIVKCGFPCNSLEKYLDIFNNLNLNVQVIDNITNDSLDNYLKYIKDLDIDNITPKISINILYKLKDLL